MQRDIFIAITIGLTVFLVGASILFLSARNNEHVSRTMVKNTSPETLSEDEWRTKLSPEEYKILREAGTETPYSSPLNNEKRAGTYLAIDTGEAVFRSEDKFDSGTGWPSFTRPIKPDAVLERPDNSIFGERTEVLTTAGGHLGHVFTDGPAPTGLRYCMNGTALRFIPDEK